MCLTIDTKLHPVIIGTRHYRPRVAEKPILVWKRLVPAYCKTVDATYYGNAIGFAPYRNIPYFSGKLLHADFTFSHSPRDDMFHYVEAGLHSMKHKWCCDDEKVVPAIIPAGAEFYVSNDVDHVELASTSLIAYRDMRALKKVHGVPNEPQNVETVSRFMY